MRILKQGNITKKKRTLLLAVILTICLCAVAFLAYTNFNSSTVDQVTTTTSVDSSAVPKGISYKMACDLLDDKAAVKVIGNGAVKNNKLAAISTTDYSLTRCEYTNSQNKKVNVALYQYTDEKKAAANKASVQKQVLVPSPDGKTTSLQPQQSAAGVKGKYVVTAAVTEGSTFNAESSNKLLEEALGKL